MTPHGNLFPRKEDKVISNADFLAQFCEREEWNDEWQDDSPPDDDDYDFAHHLANICGVKQSV